MKELKDIIVSAQNYDEESLLHLIEKFKPVILKYSKRMNYDEDFYSSLILFFIETIHKIDLSKFKILTDHAIIKYISNSIYHQYILLSKCQKNVREYENQFEDGDIDQWVGADHSTEKEISNMMINSLMKEYLTQREYICVKLMVIDGLSSTEAAKKLNISRQTVNEAKKRALRKIRCNLV